jgi:hypothetical protein
MEETYGIFGNKARALGVGGIADAKLAVNVEHGIGTTRA